MEISLPHFVFLDALFRCHFIFLSWVIFFSNLSSFGERDSHLQPPNCSRENIKAQLKVHYKFKWSVIWNNSLQPICHKRKMKTTSSSHHKRTKTYMKTYLRSKFKSSCILSLVIFIFLSICCGRINGQGGTGGIITQLPFDIPEDVIVVNAGIRPAQPESENMIIVTQGTGEEQQFLVILPPSMSQVANQSGRRINPMIVRIWGLKMTMPFIQMPVTGSILPTIWENKGRERKRKREREKQHLSDQRRSKPSQCTV